ncbi:MAG: glycosyltransferase family 4 protein [Candidatus Omnitrophica bacterium]|nr:glycosyltransferase family 4 protein [Candidatus Omnitrophota bacterium]
MNICLVSTVGYPTRDPEAGGVSICSRNLAHALTEQGHRVIVINHRLKGDPPRINDGPVMLRLAPITFFHHYLSKIGKKAGMWPSLVKIYEMGIGIRREIQRIIKEEDIDIVQYPNAWSEGVFHPGSLKMSVRMDTPLCMVRDLPDVGEHSGWSLYEKIEKSIVRRADLVSCHTPFVAEQVIRSYSIDREKVAVIPNLVDTKTFKPLERHKRDHFLIFHPDPRLDDRQKGAAILLEAMKEVLDRFPKTKLRLAGKGQIDFREYGDRVAGAIESLGWINARALAAEYAEADICVVPSIGWETFSNICAESLACGTPVVASKVGGMPDVVRHDKTGLIFPPGDVTALAQAIIELLSNPEKRLDMGRYGRIYAEKFFSFQKVAKMTEEVFMSAISNK